MKKIAIFSSLLAVVALIGFVSAHSVKAQMMGGYNQATTTWIMGAEETAGQSIAQKLEAKTLACSDLKQNDYESLGEYYMGLMMGSGHEAMDNYIISRSGQSYLDQMHVAMGERFSGCNTNVQFPAGMMGFGPMMGGVGNGYGMMNSWGNNWGSGWNMMGWYGGGYSWFGIMTMIFVWVLIILGIVAIFKAIKNKKL